MCKQNPLKHLRTLTGAARKQAMREHLRATAQIDFSADVFSLSFGQRSALHDAAKAVCWRKSISSCLSLGAAYFIYLSRGAT